MILDRIKFIFIKENVLQPNHCGGLPKKGTDSAIKLPPPQRTVDEAEQTAEPDGDLLLDLMTWDTRKAFDTFGPSTQYLAWRRVGVPADVAQWLTSMYA